jgi:hypothetical protein
MMTPTAWETKSVVVRGAKKSNKIFGIIHEVGKNEIF